MSSSSFPSFFLPSSSFFAHHSSPFLSFTESQLVPDLLAEFNPSATLEVTFDSTVAAIGQPLTITEVTNQPTVLVTPSSNATAFTEGAVFTVAMVDPATVGSDQSGGQVSSRTSFGRRKEGEEERERERQRGTSVARFFSVSLAHLCSFSLLLDSTLARQQRLPHWNRGSLRTQLLHGCHHHLFVHVPPPFSFRDDPFVEADLNLHTRSSDRRRTFPC